MAEPKEWSARTQVAMLVRLHRQLVAELQMPLVQKTVDLTRGEQPRDDTESVQVGRSSQSRSARWHDNTTADTGKRAAQSGRNAGLAGRGTDPSVPDAGPIGPSPIGQDPGNCWAEAACPTGRPNQGRNGTRVEIPYGQKAANAAKIKNKRRKLPSSRHDWRRSLLPRPKCK